MGVNDTPFSVDFSFVEERPLRALLEDYHRQAVTAYQAQAYLGTLVACGGILEGLLTWALISKGIHNFETDKGLEPVERADLSKLIDKATQKNIGLLGDTANSAAWAVKDFRNFIHPYNLLRQRKSARADQSLALSALTAVNEIARSLKDRLASRT